jgi:glycosyltransferase involved in cell wall biosynthesis
MSEYASPECRQDGRTVSVITVAFNSASTIERALQSVLDQTHPHVEHLVVDGGSTDGTVDLVRKFERPGFRWISESDRGMYYAMNKGLEMASGTCVGILNSDDWLEPEALADVSACLESGSGEYTFGDVFLASMDGRRFGLMTSLDVGTLGMDYLFTMPFPHQTCYIRRSLLKRIGFYSVDYRLSSDHDFVVRLIQSKAQGMRLPRPIANYRMGGLGGGVKTFQESRDIAIKYGMSPLRAYRHYVASLMKVTLAQSLPNPLVRMVMRLKGSRHVWY